MDFGKPWAASLACRDCLDGVARDSEGLALAGFAIVENWVEEPAGIALFAAADLAAVHEDLECIRCINYGIVGDVGLHPDAKKAFVPIVCD